MFEREGHRCWTRPAFSSIAAAMGERVGLSFEDIANAEHAISKAVKRLNMLAVELLAERLLAGDEECFEVLVDELTVPETYFFRDRDDIKFISETIIPTLQRERGGTGSLKVWSAACSTGEETYSLAILLEQAGCLAQSHVIGTDLCHSSIRRAREGTYRRWSLRGVEEHLVHKYFDRDEGGHHFTVKPHLRSAVKFDMLNLVSDDYPSVLNGTCGLDLILCRNVLIYFTPDAISHATRRFHDALAEGGWLVLGPSAPLLEDDGLFEHFTTPAGTFYRRASGVGRWLVTDLRFPGLGEKAEAPGSGGEKRSLVVPVEPESISQIPAPPSSVFDLDRARAALEAGDYVTVLTLTRPYMDDQQAAALHLRALSSTDAPEVVQAEVSRALESHPLSVEINFLHALILINAGRDLEAVEALNRVVYLDRSVALAHFFLGALYERLEYPAAARRAWRTVHRLTGTLPRDAVLPLSQGERAGALYDAAGAHLGRLEGGCK